MRIVIQVSDFIRVLFNIKKHLMNGSEGRINLYKAG